MFKSLYDRIYNIITTEQNLGKNIGMYFILHTIRHCVEYIYYTVYGKEIIYMDCAFIHNKKNKKNKNDTETNETKDEYRIKNVHARIYYRVITENFACCKVKTKNDAMSLDHFCKNLENIPNERMLYISIKKNGNKKNISFNLTHFHKHLFHSVSILKNVLKDRDALNMSICEKNLDDASFIISKYAFMNASLMQTCKNTADIIAINIIWDIYTQLNNLYYKLVNICTHPSFHEKHYYPILFEEFEKEKI